MESQSGDNFESVSQIPITFWIATSCTDNPIDRANQYDQPPTKPLGLMEDGIKDIQLQEKDTDLPG